MADSFNFELVSPERLLVSSEVLSVAIPATEGEMTIMAHHAPVMTTIKPGIVTVEDADGKSNKYVVFGGFADVLPSGCTLLAESAVHVDDLSKDELDARIEAARTELQDAQHHEHQSRLEEIIYQLTSLKDAVIE